MGLVNAFEKKKKRILTKGRRKDSKIGFKGRKDELNLKKSMILKKIFTNSVFNLCINFYHN